MGIRMLHRRAAPPRAGADGPTPEAFPPVPVFAAAASTARVPVTPATALRQATADLGRRIADGRWRTGRASTAVLPALPGRPGLPGEPPWRLWAELARAYLTLVLTLLPRPRPVRTVTVFVAASDTLTVRSYGSAAAHRPLQGPPWPDWPDWPDATP
ncbi:hypothetical protein GCM10017779_53090 [Streptomyces capillispiralis]|uniref:Uncharacterized protein n=1 Tax=Streptomyces capillispiralis TaxID=68182 RepID=A0A561TMD7_9ACTN|nr:hypothetical protein FHX78_115251 [Streptomyces capillispiralis]GHH94852.1 hypothetical protein GCM10017779_53090 [Streptomyces capillispiralis]